MIPNTQSPPLPPSVSQQQMPQMTAMQQFAQGMAGAQPQVTTAADGQGGSNEYVVSSMKQVELLLTDVAKTLTVTNPEIMESVMDAQGGVAQAPAGQDGSQGGDPQASMTA